MKYDIMSQTAKLLQQYKKNKRWLAVFLCLAVTVVLGTLAALKLYGQAMTHKMKVLECKYEVHEHTEECYDKEKPEELICAYADYAVHMHNDDCYNAKGEPVCPLEEVEPHEHTEECYEEVKTLVCELETAEMTEGQEAENTEGQSTETESAESQGTDTEAPEGQTGEAQSQGENAVQNSEAAQEPVKGDLICTQEEHAHGEACYSQILTCASEEHTHAEACMDEEGNLTCTLEEHTHGENCYGTELICTLEEHAHEDACWQWIIPEEVKEPASEAPAEEAVPTEEQPAEEPEEEAHVHTDECYVTEKVLKCGKLELHTHADACYGEDSFDEEGKLIEGSLPICGLLQLEEHTHTEECFKVVELTPEEVEALENGATLHIHEDSCYDEEGNLICGHEATHIHVPECYDDAGKVICGFGKGAHVHEESCYDGEGNLICGYETASHPHTESCYDAEGNLQCGYETAAHVHEESCYDEEGKVICGYTAASHVHGRECYDENGELICGYETAKHVHEESCYDAEGNLICGYNADGVAASALYCDEQIHRHEESCYDGEGNLICGKAEFAVHTHGDDCYNADGKRICPLPEIEVHVHSAECYPEGTAEGEAEPACGKEEVQLHTHTEECYDENGALICGKLEILEHAHSEACKVSDLPLTRTFEGGSFTVTAVYGKDANIPAEAELIAEQITEESDSEHYAQRQADYQEVLGDDNATMRALLKIGFYVKDENGAFTKEVEPESPVTLTIQFLNENGLAEGRPVTVIHFAEEGAEVLEGSEVQDGSTTFEMNSFSEIAVGDGTKNVRVPVNEELKYETEEFEVTFHIEGEVSVPVGNTKPAGGTGTGEEAAEPGDSGEGEAEESNAGSDAATEEAETGTEGTEIPEGSEMDEAEDNGDMETDAAISEGGVSVIIENDALEKNLEFRVDPLSEEAEEYARAVAAVYADGTDEAEELDDQLFLQVLSYRLLYDGQKLDLSDCLVTVEVKPSEALVEYAETALDVMTLELDEGETAAEGLEVKPEVVLTAVAPKADVEVGTLLNAMVVGQDAKMAFTINDNTEGIVTFSGTSQADRIFTVQYYANLDMVKMDADTNAVETLKVINTSGEGDGKGGNLPQNGNKESLKLLGIQANKEKQEVSSSFGEDAVTVKTENKLTEVYSEKEYHYITHPSLTYFNILAENGNYKLDEIWVLKEGGDKTSIERNSWDIYDCKERDWHFTNRYETSIKEPDFIYIRENAVIRLVCNVTTDKPVNNTMFYDYDISNGNIYSSENITKTIDRGSSTTYNNAIGGTWYLYTNKQGINNNSNNNSGGTNAEQVFGFGNSPGVNKTGMGDKTWGKNKYTLNMANNQSYGDCTFELVTNLNTDGTINYAAGVNAPNMFNDGSANGKTDHEGHLTFERKGDTYTLIAAEAGGTTIENLDKFYGRKNWNGSRYIWSNLFYPLDNVSSAGTKEHDIMFGDTASYTDPAKLWASTKTEKIKLPGSDDGKAHNHYFGMYYTVDFDLTEEYVGPLEYIFYGDDDMWVFLNGEGKKTDRSKDAEGNEVVNETIKSINGKLVCDIGGVHSSVGEYVNLWDYIEKGTEGHYTLSFFYTERGASGSTCWMQFTLPSVSFKTPNKTTGQMEIKKVVTGVETNEEFGFEIKFFNSSGEQLRDNYAYTKTAENGDVIDNDLLIWNDAKFFMKANETIKISYLPIGTKFEITEIGPVEVQRDENGEVVRNEDGNPIWKVKDKNPYTPSIEGGNVATDNPAKVTGEIKLKEVITITYNNVQQFALPETGGPGTIIYTMAGVIVLLGGAGFLYKRKFRERRV